MVLILFATLSYTVYPRSCPTNFHFKRPRRLFLKHYPRQRLFTITPTLPTKATITPTLPTNACENSAAQYFPFHHSRDSSLSLRAICMRSQDRFSLESSIACINFIFSRCDQNIYYIITGIFTSIKASKKVLHKIVFAHVLVVDIIQ